MDSIEDTRRQNSELREKVANQQQLIESTLKDIVSESLNAANLLAAVSGLHDRMVHNRSF
jgi:hypothetical protein